VPTEDPAAREDRGPRLGDDNPGRAGHQFGGLLLPTSRPFGDDLPGLNLAVELALAHQCLLVVICSREAKIEEFPADLAERLGLLLILTSLKDCDPEWLPTLKCTDHKLSKLRRSNDVGSKRNIGLALAVSLGWEYLLLVDDDIQSAADGPTLNANHLTRTLSVMQNDPQLEAIGWTLEDYDDNSVVGHARPLADLPQGIFIGGGALLLRCGPELPFFPDIYNEDWLFLIALAGGARDYKKALGLGGRVHQRSYEPFRPARARSEEVGEIIGECLMNLLEDHGPRYARALTPGYWRRSLSNRWKLLQLIKERVRRLPTQAGGGSTGARAAIDPADRRHLVDSMTAAQDVHKEVRPMELLDFVRAWRDDEEIWQQHLRKLEGGLSLVSDPKVVVKALTSSPL
jgi:hypothetical protein